MNFQTFSTFRPKSERSDVTEIDTIKKKTEHLEIFTEGIKLMPEKLRMSKTTAFCSAVFFWSYSKS